VEAAVAAIRRHVPPLDEDRILHHDITAVRALVHDGTIVEAVEAVLGTLA
jgi:histidine ammonia-lyase